MAKRKITWPRKSLLDLVSILDYYYKQNGTKTFSNKVNTGIRKAIRLLSKYPELVVQTDIENVRNLIHRDYCIFYELKEDNIVILSIWDNRQNPETLNLIH